MDIILLVIIRLIDLYTLIIVVRALLSWVNVGRDSQFGYWLHRITEPFLEKIRRIVPAVGFGIDISPILAIIVLSMVKRMLIYLIRKGF